MTPKNKLHNYNRDKKFKSKQKLFSKTQTFIRASILFLRIRFLKTSSIESSRTFLKLSSKKPLIINSISPNLNLLGNYNFYSFMDHMIKVILIGILLKKFTFKEGIKKNKGIQKKIKTPKNSIQKVKKKNRFFKLNSIIN